ncbi:MAG: GNAT family N-acetyltransferase [Acidimicrobiaceae bacterium]|nr:GNAT family N-acetyltransferase [Acidimicrobiaceae bacterium]
MAVVPVPDALEAEGLVLRHVRLCDLDVLHEAVIRNREYLRPWVGQWILREPVSREVRRHQIEEWIQEYPTGRGRNVIEENGEFRGMAGLHDRNGPRDVEVGYWVDEIHQGRGVATRATRALTRLALRPPRRRPGSPAPPRRQPTQSTDPRKARLHPRRPGRRVRRTTLRPLGDAGDSVERDSWRPALTRDGER